MKSHIKRVKELLNEDTFLNELAHAQTVDDVTQLFCKNGAELSPTQIEGFLAAVAESIKSDELTEIELESVSGGVSVIAVVKGCISWIKKGLSWGGKLAEWEKSLYKELK